MTRRTNYLGLILGGLTATMLNCSAPATNPPADTGTGSETSLDSTPGDTNTTTDTGPTPDAGPGMEYWYAVNSLVIDPNSASAPLAGYNLDNRASDVNDDVGCFHDDYFADIDTDQNCTDPDGSGPMAPNCAMSCTSGTAGCTAGVDNQLPSLAETIMTAANQDVRALLADQITNNKISILARLSDVQSLTADPAVTVRLYIGYPTRTTNCTGVTPDQEYVIDDGSLMTGATSLDQSTYTFTGSIVAGRLRVGDNTTQFVLPLPVMDQVIPLTLSATQLRLNVTATTGMNGNLGGYVLGQEVVDAVGALAPDFRQVVEGAIGGFIDIQVASICDDPSANPRRYGGIGIGLRITTVSARVPTTNNIVAARPTGACGGM